MARTIYSKVRRSYHVLSGVCPFEYIAASGYLIGNLILVLKGMVMDGNYLFPSFNDLVLLDPVALQSLSGLLFLTVSTVIFSTKKYPITGIKIAACLYFIAYGTLLLSGYNQDAFIIHALGILPSFLAATLLLKGNGMNKDPKHIFDQYPIALAGFLFTLGLPAVICSAIFDQDYTLILACILWMIANIAFAATDINLRANILEGYH